MLRPQLMVEQVHIATLGIQYRVKQLLRLLILLQEIILLQLQM